MKTGRTFGLTTQTPDEELLLSGLIFFIYKMGIITIISVS